MSAPSLPLLTRLWFALVCLVRVLFDGAFAARAFAVRGAPQSLPPASGRPPARADRPVGDSRAKRAGRGGASSRAERSGPVEPSNGRTNGENRGGVEGQRVGNDATEGQPPGAARLGADPERRSIAPLQLLSLLQREGRIVDFLQQDITSFDDADVGAAARVVHEGCRKALLSHATIEPVRSEPEDARVTVEVGYDPSEVKLTGEVKGTPPYRGVLRHRGWRVRGLRLPEPLEGHDFEVVAPAEVEL